MKEKILKQLKEKLGKTSLSERTIDSKATRLAAKYKTEEEFTSEVLEDAVADLKEVEGQLNHDVAKAVREAKEKQESTKPDNKKEEPKGLTLEDIQKVVADVVKPLSDKIEQQEVLSAAEKRNADILAKAKEYNIPESFAKRYQVPQDADLDAYFKEAQQELANEGFQGVRTPEIGGNPKEESENIASMINQGTKEIVESKN